jgi:glycerol kinase
VAVHRPEFVETTSHAAAYLAGLGLGVWDSSDDLRETWHLDRRFEPAPDRSGPDSAYARWTEAVHRSKAWATD